MVHGWGKHRQQRKQQWQWLLKWWAWLLGQHRRRTTVWMTLRQRRHQEPHQTEERPQADSQPMTQQSQTEQKGQRVLWLQHQQQVCPSEREWPHQRRRRAQQWDQKKEQTPQQPAR